ncbi:MAG: hypothetical protein IKT75_03705 [Alistipes sp.]|nr:hypothetical protein [Alistipes sp.]
MAKYDMCEALYALPGSVVVPHKKPLAMPLLITVLGATLLAVNGWWLKDVDMPDVKSALVLFGAVFAMVGGAILVARLAGSSTLPYHKNDNNYLRHETLKFKKEQKAKVMELINKGDTATLKKLPSDGISALVVEVYSSPKSGYTATQAFEYLDLEWQPVSELKIAE